MLSSSFPFYYRCLATSLLIAYSTAQDIGNDVESQNRAGAEGPDDGIGISSTGMIVLCTIVGVVAVIGCPFFLIFHSTFYSIPGTLSVLTNTSSFLGSALLHRQAPPMGYARDSASICTTCRRRCQDAPDAKVHQVAATTAIIAVKSKSEEDSHRGRNE